MIVTLMRMVLAFQILPFFALAAKTTLISRMLTLEIDGNHKLFLLLPPQSFSVYIFSR